MLLFYSLIVLNLIIFSDNIELQFKSFYQSDQTFKKYDKQRKNTTLERSLSFSLHKEYMIKENNEQEIFGHIIDLSNRMY